MSDGVNRYLYDGEGRLCAYQNVAVAGNYGPMMGYVYGPDGFRVGKGTISAWTCNPLTAGFTMTASYVLGPGGEQVSEMAVTGTYGNYSSSWQHTNVFDNGSLLATYNGTETYFALSDWLGTKRAEITPDGQSTRFFQLPYGNGLASNGSLADATEQHFTGKERDTESGLDYFKYRYYASSMGRWLSPDPSGLRYANLADPQSFNLYSYVGNKPLTVVDLEGLCWKGFTWACRAANAAKDLAVSAKNKFRWGEWTTNTQQAEIRSLDRQEAHDRNEDYQKETAGNTSQNGLLKNSAYSASTFIPLSVMFVPIDGVPIPVASFGFSPTLTYIPKHNTW
ncbi:MAG: RHS repeat-associated core domain-containing protein, partial [Acidobacteriaceae bacterium]